MFFVVNVSIYIRTVVQILRYAIVSLCVYIFVNEVVYNKEAVI